MGTTKFAAVALWLACATPAFAGTQDKEVWITIGTDALEPVRASFLGRGQQLAAPVREKDGVAMLRVRESQLEQLAEVIHSKLNRCAGFIAHETEEQALTAVETHNTAQAAQPLISYTIDNATTANALLSVVQESTIRSTITSLSTKWTSRRHNLQSGIDAAN